MASKGLFKMGRQMKTESEALSSAGSKQSLWSKVGMGLGGAAAMALTGGAATPLVAAMMAGGGTLAGGLLGRQGAKKGWFGTDKAKMKGGRFYRDEAAKWKKDIGESIWSGAAQTGLTAGMSKLGSGLTFGKEGLKAAIPGKSVSIGPGGVKTAGEGFKMGDIVKRGAETATYGEGLMGRLGKAIDFKGSVIGSKVGTMMHEGGWIGKELRDWGEESLATGRGVPGRRGHMAPGEMTAKMRGPGSGLTFDDPGQYARRADPNISDRAIRGSAQTGGYLDRINKIPEAPEVSGPQTSLSADERNLYDTVNKMTDEGYPPTYDPKSGYHELSEEMGRGFIDKSGNIVRQPDRPDVPFTPEVEDTFFDADIKVDEVIDDGSWIDDPTWAEGEKTLKGIDQKRSRSQAEARYLHAGRGENVWDIVDKGDYQSTTSPFDTSDIGTGLSAGEEQFAHKLATQGTGTSFGLQSSTSFPGGGGGVGVRPPDFIRSDASRAAGASQYSAGRTSALDARRHKGMLDSVRWQNRLFGE